MNPQFPIYIISKGRWESRLTSKTLEFMDVPYHIVVEPQEYADYAAVIDPKKILRLDMSYKEAYDPCDDLGSTCSKGSGPARNFCWDHSVKAGHSYHWLMDDNLQGFFRLTQNTKIRVKSGAIFKAMEDFVLRYRNIALAGPQYSFFAKRKQKLNPFSLNSKCYSCILIRNDLPLRWRARFNEDVDLTLRVLKAGWCTIQFNAFLQGKAATLSMKGGNTEELYANGSRKLEKSKMIARLHPDVAKVTYKFNRWHHSVQYSKYKRTNKLVRNPDVKISKGVNNYGLVMLKKPEGA